MNYQTEIDFALRILQDLESRDFDEEKMRELMQHDADYMRVFLPQPHALDSVCRSAHGAFYDLERTIAIEKSIIANETRYEELTQQLEKLSAGKLWFFQKKKKQKIADLKVQIEELRLEIYQCMDAVQSPSAAPWEQDREQLGALFIQLLCPPDLDNTEEFEQVIYHELYRFYNEKANYFESLYK